MSEPKFIVVPTIMSGEMIINLDNIASVEFGIGGSTIILKQVKDGNNVQVPTQLSVAQVKILIGEAIR
jgi:hypothetical protein